MWFEVGSQRGHLFCNFNSQLLTFYPLDVLYVAFIERYCFKSKSRFLLRQKAQLLNMYHMDFEITPEAFCYLLTAPIVVEMVFSHRSKTKTRQIKEELLNLLI